MKRKKVLRNVGVILSLLVFIIVCGVLYLKFFLPNIKVKDINVEITKERIKKGEYLANSVLVCIDCHSTRDWSKYSGPILSGTEGMGGEIFDQKMGLPGKYIATNITPYTLGSWSDGEIYRAITSGVGKHDNALFPIMPCSAFGTLDDEDVYCVIAYLRSIPSIKNDPPISKSDFPVNFLINTMPKEGHSIKRPKSIDTLKYGEYITTIAGCIDCHTPVTSKGELIMEKAYSGGKEFLMGDDLKILSTNITFNKETGIGEWDRDFFVEIFKSYDLSVYKPNSIEAGEINTPMPWTMYASMDTTDLEAIFYYLKSLPPIEN